ncbi:MAG: hypothetical protein HY699_19995 [Deltaproteobacteria bacterium]|nr:hypothetical protein [Deltaproteobacteria bacterium]
MTADSALAAYDRRVDRAFRRWVNKTLPPELRGAAFSLPYRLGYSAQPGWRSWRDVFGTPVFRSLPYLVGEGFPHVARVQLDSLGLAHVLLIFLALVDDAALDSQVGFSRSTNLIRRSLELELGARLATAVGALPGFWRLYRRMFREYNAGHASEPALWAGMESRYDHARYARDSAAKTAIAGLPGLAVALLGGATPAAVSRLGRVIDRYLVGMQYLDDAADWEDDFRSGRWTYFIQLHLQPGERRQPGAAPGAVALRHRSSISIATMRKRVAASAVTEEFLFRASGHYAACVDLLEEFTMPAFRRQASAKRDALARLAGARRQLREQQRDQFIHALRRCWSGDAAAPVV